MSIKIPPGGGVPGIAGPPNWLSAPPTGNYSLEDVRWLGAIKRVFGAGGAGSNSFRATQAIESGQQYLYLSFRAAFVPTLSDQFDAVYLGLRKKDGTKAMVIRLQAHSAALTSSGPPSATPPAALPTPQASTRSDVDVSWTVAGSAPGWVATNSRGWLQKATDVMADPNNRWAVQVKVPVVAGTIDGNAGPDLGTEFDMWYMIVGTLDTMMGPAPAILGEQRVTGNTTQLDLLTGNYPNPFPMPSLWERFVLGAADTFGGVAIHGNGSTDVRVWNAAYGEGTTIDNGSNTFIARPRNYRPSPNDIAAGGISATFRIANWGSVGGDPHQIDWASGTWDYIPGNDALNPVLSSLDIPTLAAGANPPGNRPIELTAMMSRGAGTSYHQCIYVTLSGGSLQFLNDSTFQNMSYEIASVVEREAEINVRGVEGDPPEVLLAIEKLNMPRDLPGGTDNGRFLQGPITELMRKGGPLAEKYKVLRSRLAQYEGVEKEQDRLAALIEILTSEGWSQADIETLFPTFRVHAYHDTGERVTNKEGNKVPVYREQSSFGLYAYHEGPITGWSTSIEGADRTGENVYRVSIPAGGVAKIRVRVQAVTPQEDRIPEDRIVKEGVADGGEQRPGCLGAIRQMIMKLLGM
jgi:hypothetical protein